MATFYFGIPFLQVKDKKVHLVRERETNAEVFIKEKPAPLTSSLLSASKRANELKEETSSVAEESN